jgi:hypothetical protein
MIMRDDRFTAQSSKAEAQVFVGQGILVMECSDTSTEENECSPAVKSTSGWDESLARLMSIRDRSVNLSQESPFLPVGRLLRADRPKPVNPGVE